MMAFGSGTHEREKPTSTLPTKSAVLGLAAAALGREYGSDQRDLQALLVHVRVDAPGRVQADFQTIRDALRADGTVNPNIAPIRREHLHDAAFLVVLQGEGELLRKLETALKQPVFPIYLGLRSCPPARPVYVQPGTAATPLECMQGIADLTGTGGNRLVLFETPHGALSRFDQPLAQRGFTSRQLTMAYVQTQGGQRDPT